MTNEIHIRETTLSELNFKSESDVRSLRVTPEDWTLLVSHLGSGKITVLNAVAPVGMWHCAMLCLSREFLENEGRYIDSLRASDTLYDEINSELMRDGIHRDTVRTTLFGRFLHHSHYGSKLNKQGYGSKFRGDESAERDLRSISATVPRESERDSIQYIGRMIVEFGEFALRSAPPLVVRDPNYNVRRDPFYEMLYGNVTVDNVNREQILKTLDARIQSVAKGSPALPRAHPYPGRFPSMIPRSIEQLDFEVACRRCQLLLLELDPREYLSATYCYADWNRKISDGFNNLGQAYSDEWRHSAEIIRNRIAEYIEKIVACYPVLKVTPFVYAKPG